MPLPKSVSPARQAENADVFGWALSDADMATMDGWEAGASIMGAKLGGWVGVLIMWRENRGGGTTGKVAAGVGNSRGAARDVPWGAFIHRVLQLTDLTLVRAVAIFAA